MKLDIKLKLTLNKELTFITRTETIFDEIFATCLKHGIQPVISDADPDKRTQRLRLRDCSTGDIYSSHVLVVVHHLRRNKYDIHTFIDSA